MLKIHLNQSINYLSMKEKKRDESFKTSKNIYWLFKTIDDAYENLENYNLTKK